MSLSSIGAALHFEAGTPLRAISELIGDMRGRSGRVVNLEFERITNGCSQLVSCLIEGRERISPPRAKEFEAVTSCHAFAVREIWIDVLFGTYAQGRATMWEIADDYERVLMGFWLVPIYAVVSVIVLIERWPSAAWRERSQIRRALRKRRATLRRWAGDCEANYGPMLALVDAELAIFHGRVDEALQAYELARTGAAANRIVWLAGLASHRLAIAARHRGLGIMVEAGVRAAREAYHAWGADALVRMLDAEFKEVSGTR